MFMQFEKCGEKIRLIVMAILLICACFVVCHFRVIYKTQILFTHLFYIPIVLASCWWKKRGIFVALFLSVLLVFTAMIFKINPLPDMFRSMIFLFVSFMVAMLSEQTGKKEERIQQLILESTEEGIIGLNCEGKHIFANSSALQMLGYKIEELVGRKSHPIWHHSKKDRSFYPEKECPICETYTHGISRHGNDELFWRKDGTNFHADYVSRPIKEGDQLIGAVISFKDITEHKRVETLLRESESKLTAILENSRDAIGVSHKGLVFFVNQSFVKMFGYEQKDEVVGKTVIDFIAPTDRFRIIEAMSKGQKGEPVSHFYEVCGVRKDGVEFDIEINSATYALEGERYGLAVLRDITERKKIEKIIDEANERISFMLQSLPIAIYTANAEGSYGVTFVSPNIKRLTGYVAEDFITNPSFWIDRIHPDDAAKTLSDFSSCREGKYNDSEYRWKIADGSYRWVHDYKLLISSKDGKEKYIFGTIQDVTEQKQSEKIKRDSEMKYRRLFESAKDGIFILNADTGAIVDVNPFLTTMLCYPYDELLGKKLWEISLFKDISANQEMFLKLKKEGYCRYEYLPLVTKNGRRMDVEFVSNVYSVNDEKVIQCNVRDITERKKAEEEIRRIQNQQEAILSNIPDIAWLKNRENKFIAVNEAFRKACGKKEEELIHKTDMEVWPRDLAKMYSFDDEEVLASGKQKQVQEPFVNKWGEVTWMDKILTPVLNYRGEVIGLTGIARDITKLKEAEEVLLKRETAQKEFSANVFHEFRTPLAAIRGFAETLERGGFEDVKHRSEFVRHIIKHADRLSRLVEDLLKLSVVDADRAKIEIEPLELSGFVREYVKSIAPVCREKDVLIQCRIDAGIKVFVDKTHLLEIFQNLISNAVRYNKKGGWVRISASRGNHDIKVVVKDSGYGIAKKDIHHVFERFHSADRGKARELGDTGIGLHIVKKIVESFGGKIWVNSLEGKGTTFYFLLPGA